MCEPKLKPCPFCAGSAEVRDDPESDGKGIGCFVIDGSVGCPGFSSWHASEEQAVALWNRRAPVLTPERIEAREEEHVKEALKWADETERLAALRERVERVCTMMGLLAPIDSMKVDTSLVQQWLSILRGDRE